MIQNGLLLFMQANNNATIQKAAHDTQYSDRLNLFKLVMIAVHKNMMDKDIYDIEQELDEYIQYFLNLTNNPFFACRTYIHERLTGIAHNFNLNAVTAFNQIKDYVELYVVIYKLTTE